MTLRVRINQFARRFFDREGRLNRWGLLFAAYALVLNALVYKWLLTRLWEWLTR